MKKVILGGVVVASALVLTSCGQKVDSPLDTMQKAPDAMIQKQVETDAMMVKENEAMMKQDAMMEKGDAMEKAAPQDAMMKKETPVVTKGDYVAYSPAAVDAALASGKKVALFFHASWCPSCKALDTTLKGETIPSDVIVFKVDYDTASDLRKQYGVTGQHTIVTLDAQKNMIQKERGSQGIDDIVALF